MKMNNPDRYPVEIFWSDEDEGFIAIAPDLPGCSAFGHTEDEALGELRHAVSAWREAALTAGNPMPAPSNHHANEYSGKFVVRMPRTLHRQLAYAAHKENVSLNQYVVTLLATNQTLRTVNELAALTTAQHLFGNSFSGSVTNLFLNNNNFVPIPNLSQPLEECETNADVKGTTASIRLATDPRYLFKASYPKGVQYNG